VTISSEPFGSGDWDDVPDHSLLVATATTLRITHLEGRE
jgi:glutamine amidotransferase